MPRRSLGVDWHLPGRKRPFATTTKATSDLVVLLAGDGHTVDSAHAAVNYDPDARAVLEALSAAGHGDRPLAELVA